MNISRLIVPAFAASCVLPAAMAAAQSAPGPVIYVKAARIAEDGRTSGYAMGTNDFIVGKPVTTYKYAGRVDRGDLAGCDWLGGSDDGVHPLDQLVREKPHVWKVTTTARSFERGRMVFDVEWARYSHLSGTRPVASHRLQLSLAEGERYVMDLLRPPAGSCSNSSIVLDVQAGMREDPALADAVLQYDLWLTHTDPSGKRSSLRVTTSGQHGVEVPFGFPSMQFPVPTLSADQYAFDVATRVNGSIRGRAAADGRLAVEIEAIRYDALVRRGVPASGVPFGGEGRKQVLLTPGEAIEIPLPVGGTRSSTYVNEAAAKAGAGKTVGGRGQLAGTPESGQAVTVEHGRLTLRFKPFFEGHQVSLVLRAKKIE